MPNWNYISCSIIIIIIFQANRGELPSDAEEGSGSGSESEEESESESSSSSEEEKEAEGEAKVPKAKGVSGLIELENPNRQAGKATKKVTEMDAEAKPQLSRRERLVWSWKVK